MDKFTELTEEQLTIVAGGGSFIEQTNVSVTYQAGWAQGGSANGGNSSNIVALGGLSATSNNSNGGSAFATVVNISSTSQANIAH